jgi:hypothetical protein
LQKVEARGTVEKARLFAALWDDLWEQIDHAVVGRVDRPCNIRPAEDVSLDDILQFSTYWSFHGNLASCA